jgi:hypothetical protein
LLRKIKGKITPDRHNSGTPGTISTKLGVISAEPGIHMAIYRCL